MLFGWSVETGITSNSVIYVKDGVTVGVGTGEQDRVGVAEIARDKAYRKLEDRLLWERTGKGWNESVPTKLPRPPSARRSPPPTPASGAR
jgi:phosphoribosylaminoimidazolecarboxamide formyltransferase/IMP cyclohydrolase